MKTITITSDEKGYVKTRFKAIKGLNVEEEKLVIGDFIVGNIIIERKHINDLYTSLFKGRLFRQLRTIQEFCKIHQYARSLLIIEGCEQQLSKKLSKFKDIITLDEIIANCFIEFEMPVKQTINLDHTANFIKELAGYSFNEVPPVIKNVRGYKPKKSLKAQQNYFLQGLPTIGEKRAEQIMKQFSSPFKYFYQMVEKGTNTQIFKVLTGKNYDN